MSIFMTSTGEPARSSSDVAPAPKSSTAMENPASRSRESAALSCAGSELHASSETSRQIRLDGSSRAVILSGSPGARSDERDRLTETGTVPSPRSTQPLRWTSARTTMCMSSSAANPASSSTGTKREGSVRPPSACFQRARTSTPATLPPGYETMGWNRGPIRPSRNAGANSRTTSWKKRASSRSPRW